MGSTFGIIGGFNIGFLLIGIIIFIEFLLYYIHFINICGTVLSKKITVQLTREPDETYG